MEKKETIVVEAAEIIDIDGIEFRTTKEGIKFLNNLLVEFNELNHIKKKKEKTISMDKENEAEDINDRIEEITNDHFLEGNPYFTLMSFREDVGSILENAVYDLVKKNGGDFTEMFYLREVGNHIEIGAIKKIEIIKG